MCGWSRGPKQVTTDHRKQTSDQQPEDLSPGAVSPTVDLRPVTWNCWDTPLYVHSLMALGQQGLADISFSLYMHIHMVSLDGTSLCRSQCHVGAEPDHISLLMAWEHPLIILVVDSIR